MKELKDYLHLYLGCEMLVEIIDNEGYTWSKPQIVALDAYALNELLRGVWRNSKPLLRPLSDMTEDERERFGWQDESEFRYLSDAHQVMKNYYYGWQFIDLLKLHFDLFGLIESGLAIDKSTVKN